jgi:hypothetical protein
VFCFLLQFVCRVASHIRRKTRQCRWEAQVVPNMLHFIFAGRPAYLLPPMLIWGLLIVAPEDPTQLFTIPAFGNTHVNSEFLDPLQSNALLPRVLFCHIADARLCLLVPACLPSHAIQVFEAQGKRAMHFVILLHLNVLSCIPPSQEDLAVV